MGTLDYDITQYQPVLFAGSSFNEVVDVAGAFSRVVRRRGRAGSTSASARGSSRSSTEARWRTVTGLSHPPPCRSAAGTIDRVARRPTATSNFGVGRRESHDATDVLRALRTARAARTTTTVVAPRRRSTQIFVQATRARHGRGRRRLGRARRHVAAVLRGQGVRGGARARATSRPPTSSTSSMLARRVRRVRARRSSRAGASRSTSPTSAASRTGRSSADVIAHPPGRPRAAAARRGHLAQGRGRGGLLRVGLVPAAPRTRCCATSPSGSSIASKGRFDRALTPREREQRRPAVASRRIARDEFMEATTDVWEIPPESAHARRPSGAVPGRAARAADRPLHVRGRPRARPVHGLGHHRGRGRAHRTATTSATTPTPSTCDDHARRTSRT